MRIYRGVDVSGEFGKLTLVKGHIVAQDGAARTTTLETGGGERREVFTSSLIFVGDIEDEEPTPRGAVLREAEKLITGDRNKTYGPPTENFDTTAALWNAQLGHKLKDGEQFTALDVAVLMVQLKMARLRTSPGNRDHYVDAAGYLGCGWECKEAENARNE